MIEINLIPDVKQEMVRAQRVRNTTIALSIMTAIGSGAIFVVIALLVGAQSIHESIVRGQIKDQYAKLKNTDNIDNALTIQNQLSKITAINDKKTIDSRLFDILSAINPSTPNDIRYSTIKLDPDNKTLRVEGVASNGYTATETFQKLILNTKVESTNNDKNSSVPLTDAVVISETSYGEGPDGSRILRFTLSFTYPDGLFDNRLSNVRIVTPTSRVDVTDSRTRVPDSLFSEKAKDVSGGN